MNAAGEMDYTVAADATRPHPFQPIKIVSYTQPIMYAFASRLTMTSHPGDPATESEQRLA
jgi:hypothetical protein